MALELAKLALVILQVRMQEESRMRATGNPRQPGQPGAEAGTAKTPASTGVETTKPSRWRTMAGHLKEALGWVALLAKLAKDWPILSRAIAWSGTSWALGALGRLAWNIIRWLGLW